MQKTKMELGEEIENHDWDDAVADDDDRDGGVWDLDCDDDLDDEEEKAVRQDSFAASSPSSAPHLRVDLM